MKPELLVFTTIEATAIFAALGDFNQRLNFWIDTEQFNRLPLNKQLLVLEGKALQDHVYTKTMKYLTAAGLGPEVKAIFNEDTQRNRKPRGGI